MSGQTHLTAFEYMGASGRLGGRAGVLLAAVVFLTLLSVSGCAAPRGGTPDPAPCGPASWPLGLRRLVPQQFGGADFRPACRCHDRCYETAGAERTTCDDGFRQQLHQACDSSRHPVLCRLVANTMHVAVAVCGGSCYRRGQSKLKNGDCDGQE